MCFHSERVGNFRGYVLVSEYVGSTQQKEVKRIETLTCSAGDHDLKDKAEHTNGL